MSAMAAIHSSSAVLPRSCSARSKGSRSGLALRLLHGHPLAGDVDEALGVPHDEVAHREPEQLAVLHGEVVGAGDAHGAELGVQAGGEVPAGVDAAAHAILRLEDDDIVALALQLVRGHQPGDAGAEHDDPLADARPPFQPVLGHAHGLLGHGLGHDRLRRPLGQELVFKLVLFAAPMLAHGPRQSFAGSMTIGAVWISVAARMPDSSAPWIHA